MTVTEVGLHPNVSGRDQDVPKRGEATPEQPASYVPGSFDGHSYSVHAAPISSGEFADLLAEGYEAQKDEALDFAEGAIAFAREVLDRLDDA